jgi:hypothetical protein
MHKPNYIFQNNSKYISAFLHESLLESKEIDTKCMWMSIWKNPWKQKDVHASNYMKKTKFNKHLWGDHATPIRSMQTNGSRHNVQEDTTNFTTKDVFIQKRL